MRYYPSTILLLTTIQQGAALPQLLRQRQLQQQQTFTTPFFSDEDAAVSCHQFGTFALVSGLYCDGGRCDKVRLECTIPSENDIGESTVESIFWTPYFSEEDNRFVSCGEGYFVTDLDCDSGRCDNISLQCTKFSKLRPNEKECQDVSDFSDEDGYVSFASDQKYLTGMRRERGRCDNKDLRFCGSQIHTSEDQRIAHGTNGHVLPTGWPYR